MCLVDLDLSSLVGLELDNSSLPLTEGEKGGFYKAEAWGRKPLNTQYRVALQNNSWIWMKTKRWGMRKLETQKELELIISRIKDSGFFRSFFFGGL